MGGPISEKFANKVISRVIEIRGDQTLEQLHQAIFQAYDRWERAPVRVSVRQTSVRSRRAQLRDRRSAKSRKKGDGDARTTKLDDLDLKPDRVFGYWFDFGDDWFHQVQVERIEQAIPTVDLPARHQASGQVSAAVFRRMMATNGGNDVEVEEKTQSSQAETQTNRRREAGAARAKEEVHDNLH